ncbi:hypothetical protein L284_09640 [Novosphingobium lindaniclasticum LE124]|uniref:Uncharacterized protein n=1 Tax=Novosphingobium lindaniclasticum LE124 TaxID=1096930 RepID=T0J356_9SPHN|nr:hypothetical protein L284_09640 [Novosphingobium lindaniclasticum LE124]
MVRDHPLTKLKSTIAVTADETCRFSDQRLAKSWLILALGALAAFATASANDGGVDQKYGGHVSG